MSGYVMRRRLGAVRYLRTRPAIGETRNGPLVRLGFTPWSTVHRLGCGFGHDRIVIPPDAIQR